MCNKFKSKKENLFNEWDLWEKLGFRISRLQEKVLAKTSPNYLQYKIHKRRLLSWIHFIVIIRANGY